MSIDKDQIIAHYDFENVQVIEYGKLGLILSTPQKKYILRTIKYSSQMERIFYDQSFTEFLAGNGYPARRFVKNRDDRTVSNILGESCYVTEYFEGALQPNIYNKLSDSQMSEAGKSLANLHSFSTSYAGPKRQKVPYQSGKVLKKLEKIASAIFSVVEKKEVDLLAQEIVKIKYGYVSRNPFEKSSFMSQKRLVNHGDFHAGNLVFDEKNSIIAVLDFEYCTDMPRIWDVAWALSCLCGEKPNEAFSGYLDLKKINIFLSGYHENFPLTVDEQLELVNICISGCYHETFSLYHTYVEANKIGRVEKFESLEELFWWVSHQDEIKEVVMESCK